MTEAADSQKTGRRQGKSSGAFRTISEVAKDLNMPAHVLRFWESKFTQVKPLKRGGGRRYYRPEDVDLLRGIRELLYTDGYTIKGVQKLFREGGVKRVFADRPNESEMPSVTGDTAPQEGKDLSCGKIVQSSSDAINRAALCQVLDELEDLRGALKTVGI
jgi:DNA-binding transcriptional MerR regulator